MVYNGTGSGLLDRVKREEQTLQYREHSDCESGPWLGYLAELGILRTGASLSACILSTSVSCPLEAGAQVP